MVIALNFIIATNHQQDEKAVFIRESFSRIIAGQPRHTFIIISDRKEHLFSSFKNVKSEIIPPTKSSVIQWYWWFNFKIPALLKKYSADVLFSCEAISFASVKARQYLLVTDLSFLLQPGVLSKTDKSFGKRFLVKSMKKADKIFSPSSFCKAEILQYARINQDRIEVIYPGMPETVAMADHEEKEAIKTKYANSREYFLNTGLIDNNQNLLNLLKAFSAFKKRQKSNMQLILAGEQGIEFNHLLHQLRSYKFREDVKILTGLTKQQKEKILITAYGLADVARFDCFSRACLLAMRLSVPVITCDTPAMHEVCFDAALYANPENFEELALQMMLLFKDENLRNKMIQKGLTNSKNFSWDDTAKNIWASIERMKNKQ